MNGYNYTGYLIFAFVTSITPGPNNYLLFSVGKNYGIKSSIGLMTGIFLGFITLLYFAGYGIAALIDFSSLFGNVLKVICSIWLLYLAFQLRIVDSEIKPPSILKQGIVRGFILQFVNPKAWIMAIVGSGSYLPKLHNIHLSVFIFSFSFATIGIPCMFAWVKLGDIIYKFLKSEKANFLIGLTFLFLMLISILLIWLD